MSLCYGDRTLLGPVREECGSESEQATMEDVKHNLLVFLFGEQPDRPAMWTAVIALITLVGVMVAR